MVEAAQRRSEVFPPIEPQTPDFGCSPSAGTKILVHIIRAMTAAKISIVTMKLTSPSQTRTPQSRKSAPEGAEYPKG